MNNNFTLINADISWNLSFKCNFHDGNWSLIVFFGILNDAHLIGIGERTFGCGRPLARGVFSVRDFYRVFRGGTRAFF